MSEKPTICPKLGTICTECPPYQCEAAAMERRPSFADLAKWGATKAPAPDTKRMGEVSIERDADGAVHITPAPNCDSSGEADSTSETPRTDLAFPIIYDGGREYVLSDFAAQLERELAQAKADAVAQHKRNMARIQEEVKRCDRAERELAQAIKERDEARDEIKEMHSADSWMSASFLVDKQKAEQQLATATEALEETLAEMEALMRLRPSYQGGINIANRAKQALAAIREKSESVPNNQGNEKVN